MVQFVELRRFLNKSTGTWDKEALARAILAEIPAQVRRRVKDMSERARITAYRYDI